MTALQKLHSWINWNLVKSSLKRNTLTKESLYVYFGPVAVWVCRRFDLSPFWPYPCSTGVHSNDVSNSHQMRWRMEFKVEQMKLYIRICFMRKQDVEIETVSFRKLHENEKHLVSVSHCLFRQQKLILYSCLAQKQFAIHSSHFTWCSYPNAAKNKCMIQSCPWQGSPYSNFLVKIILLKMNILLCVVFEQ